MVAEQAQARAVVIEWIDHILERKRWTGTDLARKANLAPSTVLRMLNDPNHRFTPSLKTLQKISDGSGYPIPRKVTEALGAPDMEAGEQSVDDNAGSKSGNPGPSRQRQSQIKTRYVSSLPKSMHPSLKSEVSLPCPASLEGDDTAFAFYLPGTELEPWLRAGTLMFATQKRDPYAGDIVLITDKNGKSKVRLLLDITEQGLSLSKEHPTKKAEIVKFDDLSDVAIVAVIERM